MPPTPNVRVSIAPNGIILTQHDAKDPNFMEVMASIISVFILWSSRLQLLMQIHIRQVSYTGADTKERRILAFVSRDPDDPTMYCHVFRAVSDKVWPQELTRYLI